MKTTTHEITAANIDAESYHNLCHLCRLTGYAYADAAARLAMRKKCADIVRTYFPNLPQ